MTSNDAASASAAQLESGHVARAHTNRARAESFGAVAAAYDRARPDYPSAVIDELVSRAPSTALDIGCGTGKAGRLLLARGIEVLGIEIDEQMAAMARSHGLTVDVAPFESWSTGGAQFDLLVAAQSWHWIDPAVGIAKAADLLRPNGRLALLWNYPDFDPATRAMLDRAYLMAAPELTRDSTLRGDMGRSSVPHYAAQLSASDRFATVEHRRYPWTQTYRRAEWLELTSTHSDHLVLEPVRRARLMNAIAAGIDSMGGIVTVQYVTEALLAQVA